MGRDEIVVASVPGDHPYVRSIAPLDAPADAPADALLPRVTRLPDPHPDDPTRTATDRWWPPVMLRPAWAASADFDLAHLHFGYDTHTPAELRAWCDELDRRRRPLVLTVHDLSNPHHDDPALLDAQLDVLVPAATTVLTLTPHAAAVLRRRWGVRAEVVPHPHLVDLSVMAAVRRRRRAATRPAVPVVGVAAKELRAGTDVVRLLPALGRAVERAGARLVVTVHRAVLRRDDDRAVALVRALGVADQQPGVDVVAHDRWDDATLWAHVAGLQAAVLPYRHGTHSGWLEMCHDLGTPVVAPSFGGFADQGADAVFGASGTGTDTGIDTGVDEAGLEDAVVRVLARDPADLPGLEADERAAQRHAVGERHRRIYQDALAAAARRQPAARVAG